MSARRLTACRILGGVAVFAAAKRGDLPVLHLVGR